MNKTLGMFVLGLSLACACATTGAFARTLPTVPQTRVTFSMHSLDGAVVSSDSIRGKVTVFAFGAIWLPLSKTQLQGIKELSDHYAAAGVSVYWVSIDSDSPKSKNFASDDQIRSFVTKNNIQVKVLRDPEGALSKQFGIDQIPAAVIIGKDGTLAGGPISGLETDKTLAAQLEPRLKELLKTQ